MKKVVLAVLALMLALSLAACGDPNQVTINVYNWGEYISDGSEESLDVIEEFEEQTGIRVNYTTFSTNEELYAKLKNGAADYDVIIPSDYMIARMIEEDMLEKLDFTNIENYADVMPDFKNPDYDPTNEYSVPYTWGTVGIVYNTTKVTKPVDSWDILWDPDYSGKILMFNNSRDAFAIALKKLGYSMNTTDTAQLDAAVAELTKQREVFMAYVMDEIFDMMGSGEAYVAPYYAGDAITMMEDNPDLAFAFPKEGTNRFVDAMCIPKGSEHKKEAEMFINFMCSAEIAAANIEYIGYSTPIQGAYDLLDDEIKNNPIIYPSDEIIANTEVFINLPKETNDYVQNLWIKMQVS